MIRMDNKLRLIVLISFLFSIPNAQGQITNTFWGPGENYEVTYIYSEFLSTNNEIISNENNLPVVIFIIDDLNSGGYNYSFNGFKQTKFKGSVNMTTVSIENDIFEYPKGAIPILLPIIFNNNDNWIERFTLSLPKLVSSLSKDELPFYFSGDTQISQDFVKFVSNETLTSSMYGQSSNPPVAFPKISDLLPQSYSDSMNGYTETSISYNRNTGILFSLGIKIVLNNYTLSSVGNRLEASQSIEFMALLPPNFIIDNLFNVSNSILFILILIFILMRKRKFY